MAQSAQTLLKKLKKNVWQSCYFLQGEEVYYIDAITQHFATQILAPEEKALNLTTVYGKSASMAAVLTQARRFPMHGPHQVVIIKEAQEMADLKKEKGKALLLHYLDHPQPTTCLVFAHKYKTIDARSSLSKALDKHQALFTSSPISDQALPKFIQERAIALGFSIQDAATWMLQEYVGNNLTGLVTELEKLQLTLPSDSTITTEIVDAHIGQHKSFHAFEFQLAVMQKDYPKSYRMLTTSFLHAKDQPTLMVIALLYGFFSKLLVLHQTQETDPNRAAQQTGVPVYFIGRYLKARSQYTLAETLQNINHLYEADLQCKGVHANMTDYQIMKELTFKLMHQLY